MPSAIQRYEPPPPMHGPFHSGDPLGPPSHPASGSGAAFYPLTVGRAVSLSFSLYRFAWRTLIPISVLTAVPTAVATALAGLGTLQQISDWERSVFSGGINTGISPTFGLPLDAFLVIVIVSAVSGVFMLFGFAALADAINRVIRGQAVSVGGSLRAAVARWQSLGAVYLVILLVVGLLPLVSAAVPSFSALGPSGLNLPGVAIFVALIVTVAVIFALVFVAVRVALTIQALMIEGLDARSALKRSWMLVTGSMLRLIGWAIVFALIVALLSLPFSFLILVIEFLIAPPHLTFPPTVVINPAGYVTQSVLTTLVSATLLPIVDIGFVLLYFDMRSAHGDKVPVPGQPEAAV